VPNGLVDGYYWPAYQGSMPGGSDNTSTTGPREWLFVFNEPYTGSTSNVAWQQIAADPAIPVMYMFTWNRQTTDPWSTPIEVTFTPRHTPDSSDVFEFVIPALNRGRDLELASADRIGVFPNPYYAQAAVGSGYYTSERQRVTFNNLPQRATIRIYNLAGHLVRSLFKDAPSQFIEWNLQNESGWLVASGMYLCHVELPDLGVSKVLKVGIIAGMEGIR
jgi:hypothetical protein